MTVIRCASLFIDGASPTGAFNGPRALVTRSRGEAFRYCSRADPLDARAALASGFEAEDLADAVPLVIG